ncbi:MAG: cyclodeaminase/cyclohydrolase family protein [Chloroflexi bacterium]|nr:cyclodeaminase/cyclohydrolase family protein [Chloroflexota bacterium]
MEFGRLSLDDFAAQLASAEPAPGGGAAAALVLRLAASLLAMVCRHTIGRPKYAAVEARMQAILAEADALAVRAGELMDDDAVAYAGVAAAFKLSRESPDRAGALDLACRQATDVPLQVIRAAARVAELAAEAHRDANQTLRSDARAALLAAQAAAEMSVGNVDANRPYIADQAWSARATEEARTLLASIASLRDQLAN